MPEDKTGEQKLKQEERERKIRALHAEEDDERKFQEEQDHADRIMKEQLKFLDFHSKMAESGLQYEEDEEKITSEGEEKHKETKKTPVPKKETSHTNTGAAEETSYYKGKEMERKNRYVSKGSVGRIG